MLKSYDTNPSILDHPLSSSIARSSSGEADVKRAKLSPAGTSNITTLVRDGAYDTLAALEKDVEDAVNHILAANKKDDSAAQHGAFDVTTLQAQTLAFRKVLKNLLTRETSRMAEVVGSEEVVDVDAEGDIDAEGEDEVDKSDEIAVAIMEEEPQVPQSRTVLTLYGATGQVPKQLFSSLQQSRKIMPANSASTLDTSVQITLPLRESSLPNIMSTTEVYPLPEQTDVTKRKTTTIGDVFRAPTHLPQISPPKAARPTTAKSNTITFAPPDVSKPSRKGSHSYTNQTLSSGFWLGYAGVDMPKDQSSPTARQKSRQRALSMGEAQQPPSETILVAVQQAREDALFRSAYSSFAPSRDDASAIVPEETKNRVWWQKVGEKRFNEMFPIDPALLDGGGAVGADSNGGATEEDTFKDVVENFEPIEGGVLLEPKEKSQEEKDTDEILIEVSQLLETLASHQRIRNSSLTTNPRTPVVQNSSLASLAGSPSMPSTEEFDVYQMLKSQLTFLISQLPPFAVAKLNGDQLEELNISRTILFDTKEYKGVLEEDQLSRLAKAPAQTVSTPATLARSGSGTHTHYPTGGNQYARPAATTHQSGARPVQSAQSLYPPQQQSLHRSSSMLSQRSPSGTSHNYQAGGVSYAPNSRSYSGSQSQSYSQQTPRPSFSQTPSGSQYPQRSAQTSTYGGAAASQYYGSTPQTQPQNRYTSQTSQNGYFSRAQNVAPMYNAVSTPQKAPTAPMQSVYSTRNTFGTPVTGTQNRSSYYGTSQYATPSASSTQNTTSSDPRQMMMDRQQSQMAAQSQARLAAQNSFSSSRQGSDTPQPPSNSFGGQVNGASMST